MGIDRRNGALTNSIGSEAFDWAYVASCVRLLLAAGFGPFVRSGGHIGQASSTEQVILLFAGWKPRGFLPHHSSERCEAIPKGKDLLETAVHEVGPIIRLTAACATGRMILRLDLTLDQPLERLRDLPFLIARDARS